MPAPPATSTKTKKAKGQKLTFPSYQNAVYTSKLKSKKFFLDLSKKQTRLTKAEFCSGLRNIFDAESIDVSDLGIELLWEQMPKDPTNRYCSVNDFATRFTTNASLGLTLAPTPKSPTRATTARSLTHADVKSLQQALFFFLNGWRYTDHPILASPAISRSTLPAIIQALCVAERADAAAYAREPECFHSLDLLTTADASRVLDGLDLSKRLKPATVLTHLSKVLSPALQAQPSAPLALNTLLSRLTDSASALPDHVLASVAADTVRPWVADVLFLAQRHSQPQRQLRLYADRVSDGPLLCFPPLTHWEEPMAAEAGVESLSDPRCAAGSLLLFTNTVLVNGVKALPACAATERSGVRYVVHAQHLYGCESAEEGVVVQWRMRAKVYLDGEERPVHITVEDHEAWVNGALVTAEASGLFDDWDYEDMPFQSHAE
jgi:hypothetical protein